MSMLSMRRLTLRPPQIADFPVCRDVRGPDADMATGGSRSDKESRRQLSEIDGRQALSDFGWFTVADGDGRAGVAGAVPVHAETELGRITYRRARRHGYAVDAASVGRSATLFPDRPVSGIDNADAASQAGARRLGAAPDGTCAMHGRERGASVPEGAVSLGRSPIPSCRLDVEVAAKRLHLDGRPFVQEAQS